MHQLSPNSGKFDSAKPAVTAGRGRSAAVAEVGVSGGAGVDLVPAMRSHRELGHDTYIDRGRPRGHRTTRESQVAGGLCHVFEVGGHLYMGYRG